MVRVNWFQEYFERYMYYSGIMEIWCKDIFELFGLVLFIFV